MAWGAGLFRLPTGVTRTDDLPQDYVPPVIGTTEEICNTLRSLFPEHTHELGETDYWDGCSNIQLHYDYQHTGVVDSIGVRSNGGETTFDVLKAICSALGLTVIDYQTGEIAQFDDETRDSLAGFQSYKKRVLGEQQQIVS
jgi:hypothetical protein